MKVSPISPPASRALPNRLQLTRALRPFRQRWPSSHVQDLEREATATATADLRGQSIRCSGRALERWFDVDPAPEDDDGIAAWQDTLRDAVRRCAKRVRLRCPAVAPADASDGRTKSRCSNAAGATARAATLDARRARRMFSATHGASSARV